jgi:hypothetical protein
LEDDEQGFMVPKTSCGNSQGLMLNCGWARGPSRRHGYHGRNNNKNNSNTINNTNNNNNINDSNNQQPTNECESITGARESQYAKSAIGMLDAQELAIRVADTSRPDLQNRSRRDALRMLKETRFCRQGEATVKVPAVERRQNNAFPDAATQWVRGSYTFALQGSQIEFAFSHIIYNIRQPGSQHESGL